MQKGIENARFQGAAFLECGTPVPLFPSDPRKHSVKSSLSKIHPSSPIQSTIQFLFPMRIGPYKIMMAAVWR